MKCDNGLKEYLVSSDESKDLLDVLTDDCDRVLLHMKGQDIYVIGLVQNDFHLKNESVKFHITPIAENDTYFATRIRHELKMSNILGNLLYHKF